MIGNEFFFSLLHREKFFFFVVSKKIYPSFLLISCWFGSSYYPDYGISMRNGGGSFFHLQSHWKKKKNSELESVPFLRIRRFSRTTRRRNAAPFIPGTWIHLCSHFPWFSFRIYGVEANFFLSSLPFALYLFWNIERERERARQRRLKNTRKNFSSNSYNRIDQSSKSFGNVGRTRVPLSSERERDRNSS